MIEKAHLNVVTNDILGACIEVHRHLGPGLLESAYEHCTFHELLSRKRKVERQVPLPVVYKGVRLDVGYRLDLVVDDIVIVELKSVDQLIGIHSAQTLSYLKLSKCECALLINFNVKFLKDGIRRFIK